MNKFFIKENQIVDKKINIIGNDVNHIKNVLRLNVEDKIEICNIDKKINFICKILKIDKDKIECFILNKIEDKVEPQIEITIFQGLPKFDKMELIIQKSVELGAKDITPVVMERSIVKLDEKTEEKKIIRWNKISEMAAKQSKRNIIPKVNNIINIKNICNYIKDYDIVLLAYEEEKQNTLKNELKELTKNTKKIGVIIGPEGGISQKEVELLKNSGAKIITLGDRILRTETVALAMISIIMYELGEV